MALRTIKFDENFNKNNFDKTEKEQNEIYNKWKFFNGIVKAMNKKELK